MTKYKTGLLLCDCGGSLRNIDLDALEASLPQGVPARRVSEMCDPEEFSEAATLLGREGVERVVVAACSPWASATTMGEALAEAGWNPGTALFVNLREQCAWAHGNAQDKAAMLLAAAVARVQEREWKKPEPVQGSRSVAILGTGPDADLVAAEVVSLGYEAVPVQGRVRSLSGGPGRFTLEVELGKDMNEVTAGALVIATGKESRFSEEDHGLELGPTVWSLSGLEAMLKGDDFAAVCRLRGLRVGFLVDVSARDSVSQTSRAVAMAGVLQSDYACETYVFARDAKVAGPGLETLYRESRASGVFFAKEEGEPARASLDGLSPSVTARMPSLGGSFAREPVRVPLDVLVLDERLSARDLDLSGLLGIGTWKGRFFQQENVRLFPIFTNRRGVWTLGGARGDLDGHDSAVEARAIAMEVSRFLKALEAPSHPDDLRKAEVDPVKCARCLTCVRACPHLAIAIPPFEGAQKRAAVVDVAACRGCGVCATMCPAKAISYSGYSDEEFYAELKVMGGWRL
jgi:heterodisulfide reductase subunit A